MYRWMSITEECRDGGSNSLQRQEQGTGREAAAHAPDDLNTSKFIIYAAKFSLLQARAAPAWLQILNCMQG